MDMLKVDKVIGKKGSKTPLPWTPELLQHFEDLKKALSTELSLFNIDPDAPFRICTDASCYAIGGVLEQERDGSFVPVAFYSRKLTPSQLNWSTREKEAYAIVACLYKWAGWVHQSPITVITDHKSLQDWVTENVTTPSGPTGRRARWHEILSQFNLTIIYRKGEDNVVADALSRWAYPACDTKHDVCMHGSAESSALVKEMEKDILTTLFTPPPYHWDTENDLPPPSITISTHDDPITLPPLILPTNPTPMKEKECFKLDPHLRERALKELDIDPKHIALDLFASHENSQEMFFINKDMNAFSFDWSKLCTTPSSILWANPPFSMMEKVLTKIAIEPCRVVLCSPIWKVQPWWKLLKKLEFSHVNIPTDTLTFLEGWNSDSIFMPPL
jgi:hypothetical protein